MWHELCDAMQEEREGIKMRKEYEMQEKE